jgi:hypothetical protein
MKITTTLTLALICMQLIACSCNKQIEPVPLPDVPENADTMKLKVTFGDHVYTATLLDNATVTAFKEQLPLTIKMKELNRNEKYADLPGNLPTDASNPGTIQSGDLMLYGAGTLVLFYKTFVTSYSYTRLGRMDDPAGLAEALGSGDVTVIFELE